MTDMTPELSAKLRAPFDKSMIGRKPRKNKKTNSVIYLDYVGHAAVTDRLLQVDPTWSWEPMAFDSDGNPKLDSSGGIWIRLTVAGVTRPAYGAPEQSDFKDQGDKVKEAISDAIKNGAMRYGVALDFWSKEDLNGNGNGEVSTPSAPMLSAEEARTIRDQALEIAKEGDKDQLLSKYRIVEASKALHVVITNESGDEEQLGPFIVRLGSNLKK